MSLLIFGGGAAFAWALRFPGFAGAAAVERAGIALLCGFACLPVLLDLSFHFGTGAMTALALAVAIAGGPVLFRRASFIR
jgi:hypothetical protein